jgi:hypothetical protein
LRTRDADRHDDVFVSGAATYSIVIVLDASTSRAESWSVITTCPVMPRSDPRTYPITVNSPGVMSIVRTESLGRRKVATEGDAREVEMLVRKEAPTE